MQYTAISKMPVIGQLFNNRLQARVARANDIWADHATKYHDAKEILTYTESLIYNKNRESIRQDPFRYQKWQIENRCSSSHNNSEPLKPCMGFSWANGDKTFMEHPMRNLSCEQALVKHAKECIDPIKIDTDELETLSGVIASTNRRQPVSGINRLLEAMTNDGTVCFTENSICISTDHMLTDKQLKDIERYTEIVAKYHNNEQSGPYPWSSTRPQNNPEFFIFMNDKDGNRSYEMIQARSLTFDKVKDVLDKSGCIEKIQKDIEKDMDEKERPRNLREALNRAKEVTGKDEKNDVRSAPEKISTKNRHDIAI
jgi:hypothetical protein